VKESLLQNYKYILETGHQTIHVYLIKKCKEGDRQAQNELYKLYVDAMYNICMRMMGDEDEARDILQESFITAFTKLHTLEKEITFSGWLKRIVVNNCLNALRSKKKIFIPLEEEADWKEEDSEDLDYQNYEVKRIMNAVEKLPHGCKEVFNLYLFEGFKHKEIAEMLNITESASKAQYSKARSRIRKMLEPNPV